MKGPLSSQRRVPSSAGRPTGEGEGRAPSQRRGRGRILVVEDHPDTRDLIVAALSGVGYEVGSAGSADEGLVQLRGQRFRLVIAHLGLPGKTGAEMLREAWTADLLQGTATLLITGRSDLREAEGFDIIKKPLDLQRFLAEVRALLGELPEVPPAPARGAAPVPPRVRLVLYVTPPWASSQKALRNVRRILEDYDPAQVELEVCDLSKDPLRGEADRIVFSPTLVKQAPEPRAWVMGDLSDPQVVGDLLLMSGVARRR